jgi:signal transduction histidine kinase
MRLLIAEDVPCTDEESDTQEILDGVGEVYRALAEEKCVALSLSTTGSCCLRGSGALLRRLIGDPIANASLYTSSGGTVAVSASEDGHACRVVVSDTGIGVLALALPRIFERL